LNFHVVLIPSTLFLQVILRCPQSSLFVDYCLLLVISCTADYCQVISSDSYRTYSILRISA